MMPQRTNPTLDPASATGSAAEHVFAGLFPQPDWIVRKQLPDVFVDFLVEVAENREPTGRQFAAQVKGTQGRKGHPARLKYSAKTKQVRYWLNDCLHPVFVFLVNLETKEAHWLFVQRFAKEEIAPSALQKQTKVTLRFNPEDSLRNLERFKTELRKAEAYVRDLHPGSITAAIAQKHRELEAKDPRLEYKIVATDTLTKLHVTPKEPVALKIKVLSPHTTEAAAAFRAAVEHGADFKLEFDKLRLYGSPVFEDLNGTNGHLLLRCGKSLPGQIILRPFGPATSRAICVGGEFRVGTKTSTFRSQHGSAPVEIECTIAPGDDADHIHIGFGMCYPIQRRHGQPVLQLSHFDEILALVESVEAGRGIQADVFICGSAFTSGTYNELRDENTPRVLELLYWLKRCRAIAAHYKINPLLPPLSEVSNDQCQTILDLSDLLDTPRVFRPYAHLAVECVISDFNDEAIEGVEFGCFRFDNPNAPVDFLGQTLHAGGIRQMFTNVRVERVSSNGSGLATIRLQGSDSTLRIIEKF